MAAASPFEIGAGFCIQWDALKSPDRKANSNTVGVLTFDPVTKICDIVPSTSDLSGKVTDLSTIATEFFRCFAEGGLLYPIHDDSLNTKLCDDNVIRAFVTNIQKRNCEIAESSLIAFLDVLFKILTLGIFHYKNYLNIDAARIFPNNPQVILDYFQSRALSLSTANESRMLLDFESNNSTEPWSELKTKLHDLFDHDIIKKFGRAIFVKNTPESKAKTSKVVEYLSVMARQAYTSSSEASSPTNQEIIQRLLANDFSAFKSFNNKSILTFRDMPNHNIAYLYDILEMGEGVERQSPPTESDLQNGNFTIQQLRDLKAPNLIITAFNGLVDKNFCPSENTNDFYKGYMALLSKQQLAEIVFAFSSVQEVMAMLPKYDNISTLDREHFAHVNINTLLWLLSNVEGFNPIIASLVSPGQIALMKTSSFVGKDHWNDFLSQN